MNFALLRSLQEETGKRFESLLNLALTSSVEHGMFGMKLLEALHFDLTTVVCDNCGHCCNSVSIFSMEYHSIIRGMLTRFPPARIRELFRTMFLLEMRMAEVSDENRLRCSFRDEKNRICIVHPVRPLTCRMFGMKKSDGSRECPNVRDKPRTIMPSPAFRGYTPHRGDNPETHTPSMAFSENTPHRGDKLGAQEISLTHVENIQTKIMDNSESFKVFPNRPEIAFFPFEFWLFRYTMGVEKALELYREILIPASTPLTRLWENMEKTPA